MNLLGKLKGKSKKARDTVASKTAEATADAFADEAYSDDEQDELGGFTSEHEPQQLDISLGGLSLQYEGYRWKAVDGEGHVHEGVRANDRENQELRKESARLANDNAKLIQQNDTLRGEVHLLRFKMELLVDMLTLANLDCNKLLEEKEELEASKRPQPKGHKG
mmetsp:Transcript_42512/g.103159  ORF Transcript_42512/g.103159 Transcript_42512/m.103159 type:complete len:164 (+) Transcript_42512:114-605(+)